MNNNNKLFTTNTEIELDAKKKFFFFNSIIFIIIASTIICYITCEFENTLV